MKNESGSKKPMARMAVKAMPKKNPSKSRKPSTPGTAKSVVLNNTKSKATRPPKRQEYSQPYITPALKASLAKRPRRPIKSRQPGN